MRAKAAATNAHEKEEGPRKDISKVASARSNRILARTLLNEMIRSGRSRAEMVEFVNCFLELLLQQNGRGHSPNALTPVDPESGLPTRLALHELIAHEVDPSREARTPSVLVMFQLSDRTNLELAAQVLRHRLRGGDVLVSLGKQRVALLLYVAEVFAPSVVARLVSAITEHPKLGERPVEARFVPLHAGSRPRRIWRALLGRKQSQ